MLDGDSDSRFRTLSSHKNRFGAVVAVGLEQNRLSILLAVLHRHGGLQITDQDVFVNVVGGVKVSEPSADLALILAIVSSLLDRPLPKDLVIFGEVGLASEIRPVPSGQAWFSPSCPKLM